MRQQETRTIPPTSAQDLGPQAHHAQHVDQDPHCPDQRRGCSPRDEGPEGCLHEGGQRDDQGIYVNTQYLL